MAGAARRGPQRARVSPAIISSPGAEPLRSCEWFGAGTSGLATGFLIPDLSPNPAPVSLRFGAASGAAERLRKGWVGWFGEGQEWFPCSGQSAPGGLLSCAGCDCPGSCCVAPAAHTRMGAAICAPLSGTAAPQGRLAAATTLGQPWLLFPSQQRRPAALWHANPGARGSHRHHHTPPPRQPGDQALLPQRHDVPDRNHQEHGLVSTGGAGTAGQGQARARPRSSRLLPPPSAGTPTASLTGPSPRCGAGARRRRAPTDWSSGTPVGPAAGGQAGAGGWEPQRRWEHPLPGLLRVPR